MSRRLWSGTAYVPTLAVMTVGPTPAAERYTETLRKQSAAVGLAFERVALEPDADAFGRPRADCRTQSPAAGRRGTRANALACHISPPTIVGETLDPYKDVDGITPTNAGNLSLGLPGVVSQHATRRRRASDALCDSPGGEVRGGRRPLECCSAGPWRNCCSARMRR